MKQLFFILMAWGIGAHSLVHAQRASHEEGPLLPLTAEQKAAHALLNEEIRRAEEVYGRQKAELEARVHQEQMERVDRNGLAELQPCMGQLASADAALKTIEVERKRLLEGQEGRFTSLAELDKQRAAMYWGQDRVRGECDRLRKRLDAERPGRIVEEVRKVLPSELVNLEREHERQLASLEQRRHRLQPATRQVAEASKSEPSKSLPASTAEPRRDAPGPATSTPAQRSEPKVQPPAPSAQTTVPAKPDVKTTSRPVTPPESAAKNEREGERLSSVPAFPSLPPIASDSKKVEERNGKSDQKQPFILVRAMDSVTAMFQSAQDAVVGLVTDTSGEKLIECAKGKNRCSASVYAALLRGMKRDAVLKALGPPLNSERTEPHSWRYVLPSLDTSPPGYSFLLAFENDRVADIKSLPPN